MQSLNKLEKLLAKKYKTDFIIRTCSAYKEKTVMVYIFNEAFGSTSTQWSGAIRAILKEIEGYYKEVTNETAAKQRVL